MNRFHDSFCHEYFGNSMVWKSNYSVTCGSQPANMEFFCQNPLAIEPSKSSGVVRNKSVSQSGLNFSVNKKFLENLNQQLQS